MDGQRAELTDRVAARARGLGLELFGVCDAGPVPGHDHFVQWANGGMAGEMEWLVREPDRRSDPRVVMPGCQSAVVAGMVYRTEEEPAAPPADRTEQEPGALPADRAEGLAALPRDRPAGVIARYARGDDYHEVLKARLVRVLEIIREEADRPVEGRIYVDTGPLLERDLAYTAGLGWRAKNTHLIHPRNGSYFFLGEILLDIRLEPGHPQPFRCGSCTRCLDACPTQAFVGPGVLDARRCISYLTIELRGPIPRELRPLIGSMVFGCDICQEVCPWNRHAPLSNVEEYRARPGLTRVDLVALLSMTQDQFSQRFRGSAIKRTKRRGLLRNVAVALGNSGDRRAVPALCQALEDVEPLVRGHAAWALGRLGGEDAFLALQRQYHSEPDPWVREEITLALKEWENCEGAKGCAGRPPGGGRNSRSGS